GDRDRAAGAAFAKDHRDVRHAEREACIGRARDRLGLPALFRADPRVGARGLDPFDHRDVKAAGHFHPPHRLAVALGARHAEIVLEPALGRGALLLPDDANALPLEAAEAADDRRVVTELAVAGERREVVYQLRNVIETMRARRPTRHLRLLP